MEGWRANTLTLVLVNPKDLISLYRARRKGKQIIERYKVIFKNGEKHRLQLMVNNFKWHFFSYLHSFKRRFRRSVITTFAFMFLVKDLSIAMIKNRIFLIKSGFMARNYNFKNK